ncbi:MAG: hypothetical protein ACKPJJ_00550, partial [Planctomycetaceae bacterium]
MHGFRALQVTAEIANSLILSAGEFEAEQASDARINFGGYGEWSGFLSAGVVSSQGQAQLKRKQRSEELPRCVLLGRTVAA